MFSYDRDSVSVLMCTYIPEKNINEQVESIRKNSSMPVDLKIIISDDSPLDKGVLTVLDSHNSNDIKIVPGPMKGNASTNFLQGLRYVNDSEWVFLSDQDDIWEDDKFYEYHKVMDKVDNSIPQIIFSDASLVNEMGEMFCNSFFSYQGLSTNVLCSDDILFKNCVQGATLCLNKKMVQLLNEVLEGEDFSHIIMHDWWIAILARYCGNWTFIDKPLLRYRQHNRNVVGAQKKGSVFFRIIKNPFTHYNKLKQLKNQYQLWLNVSSKLKEYSTFDSKCIKVSFLSKLKLLSFKLMCL